MYEETNNSIWKDKAIQWQTGIESQKTNTGTHDVGFMFLTSFANGERLTQNPSYTPILLTAATSLASRYNPTVGAIKSWDGPPSTFKVIIDNMMNIELLFWGARHGGSQSWYDMAVSHAKKTAANHVRPDGSTYHLVNYNPQNGTVTSRQTVQGYADSSTWSRGQAWAIYGFSIAYRESHDPEFLLTARKTADYFIAHLPPDHVPYWDFQAPGIPNEPRDTSAAAIAASGMLELAKLETDPIFAAKYQTAAKDILSSLMSPLYLSDGSTTQAILLHGTQNKNNGNFDTGLTFGDYYFLDALKKALTIN
jgi:unsaturated chondroitin disaccharide hydrolase